MSAFTYLHRVHGFYASVILLIILQSISPKCIVPTTTVVDYNLITSSQSGLPILLTSRYFKFTVSRIGRAFPEMSFGFALSINLILTDLRGQEKVPLNCLAGGHGRTKLFRTHHLSEVVLSCMHIKTET